VFVSLLRSVAHFVGIFGGVGAEVVVIILPVGESFSTARGSSHCLDPRVRGSFWQLWSRVVAGMPPAHGSGGAGHLQAGRAKHGGDSGVAFVAACGSLRLPCVCALVLRCSKKCTRLTVCVRRVLAGLSVRV
jgi:hypothetical protein